MRRGGPCGRASGRSSRDPGRVGHGDSYRTNESRYALAAIIRYFSVGVHFVWPNLIRWRMWLVSLETQFFYYRPDRLHSDLVICQSSGVWHVLRDLLRIYDVAFAGTVLSGKTGFR